MKKFLFLLVLTEVLAPIFTVRVLAQEFSAVAGSAAAGGSGERLGRYDVSWDKPGPGSAASMPLGNGDIGLNVWVEPGGDLLFYISKTDAWGGEKDSSANEWMQQGGVLMKLGLIRVSLSPNPFAAGPVATAGATPIFFRQELHLHQAEIRITEGEGAAVVSYRIWVDANHPVIRVEASGSQPFRTAVTLHDWRLHQGDTIVRGESSRITWYHRNPSEGDPRLADPHLADITFGAIVEGGGLERNDDSTLSSGASKNTRLISIHPLTATTSTTAAYLELLARQARSTRTLDMEATRQAHRQWWQGFWDRSYIYVRDHEPGQKSAAEENAQKSTTADSVTRGYILQRFVTACAGRGAFPIKFNGSIFVVDNPGRKEHGQSHPMNADFRAWGGQYWFQNTRPMYWPRLAAGDFDFMLPLFNMYLRILPENAAAVKQYYGHDGAYFQETTPFWGGLPFMGPNEQALYTHHYFTPILELSMMMLDYYQYTGDRQFVHKYLLPIAKAGLEFFDRHFPRDVDGRILLDPDNSIEMFWKVHDPAPDIAGLRAVLTLMLRLPDDLAAEALKKQWRKTLAILPPLPIDSSGGTERREGNRGTSEARTKVAGEAQQGGARDVPEGPKGTNESERGTTFRRSSSTKFPRLLPYTGPQTAKSHNEENPELYAIYPFRLYGLGKPDLELARHSFDIRKCPQKGCWSQDPIEAAMLGYDGLAKEDISYNFTRKDAELKFPAFWATGNDYKPDEDNGGNGENGLQQMLLQSDGRKILLLPAWPAGWDADFKLHARYRTIVEGQVRNGHLIILTVTPEARRKDIIDCSQTPPGTGDGQIKNIHQQQSL